MIKFEEHDGMLFEMLEEPTPLTPDAEMPCLVRLIQDNSPMGKLNKDLHAKVLTPKICTEVIDVNDLSDYNRGSVRCDGFMSCLYYYYELIGTFVEEGSDKWALYQMMLGKWVVHEKAYPCHIHANMITWSNAETPPMFTMQTPETWLSENFLHSGWQIYTEPKPTFKVGDWVKYDIDTYLQVTEASGVERTWCKTLSGIAVYPYTSCLSKLSPYDVVTHIGCLSGTIRYCLFFDNDGEKHDAIKIFNSNGKSIAIIQLEALDKQTRELVESLLKAQERGDIK
ncbi:MAG: hypothetical protein PHX12_05865 [Proteiniphilum sp.]|nr:hypothetical protein [Proteiniphilum sp.]